MGLSKNKTKKQNSKFQLFSYGILGFPLAFVGLPIYIHAPKFYASEIGLSLSLIGIILLFIRIFDAVQDPLIGYLSDRYSKKGNFRSRIILFASPFLALSFYLLFNPPAGEQNLIAIWFTISLIIVYTAYSVININYLSLAAEISSNYNERTRVASYREAMLLVGVLFASALPQILTTELGEREGFLYFTLIFIPVLLIPIFLQFFFSPKPLIEPKRTGKNIFKEFYSTFANKDFRLFILLNISNGVAVSIPASLVLFFIEDVIKAPDHTGFFLAIYFLSGAAGMPIWNILAKKFGKKNSWIFSIIASVITFFWAAMLREGDVVDYYIICALSGLCLGGDAVLSNSLLADIIKPEKKEADASTGSYYGVWNLMVKLNLAIAAGITLPLLDFLGYKAGEPNSETILASLAFIYGGLPCLLKILTAILLFLSKIDKNYKEKVS